MFVSHSVFFSFSVAKHQFLYLMDFLKEFLKGNNLFEGKFFSFVDISF